MILGSEVIFGFSELRGFMPLAFAIVLVMVLYLIDKHNQWAKARKFGIWTASVVAVAAALFWGGSWAYAKYADWQLERSTTRHYQMKRDMISKFRGKIVFPNICEESDFKQLTDDEQGEVISAVFDIDLSAGLIPKKTEVDPFEQYKVKTAVAPPKEVPIPAWATTPDLSHPGKWMVNMKDPRGTLRWIPQDAVCTAWQSLQKN
jgi:hypothetical protein